MTQDTTGAAAPKSTTPSNYTRSSYAVPDDVHKALPGVVEALGLRSVAALLTVLARDPEVITALRPAADRFTTQIKAGSGAKEARKQLEARLKNMTPERLAELTRLADQVEKVTP